MVALSQVRAAMGLRCLRQGTDSLYRATIVHWVWTGPHHLVAWRHWAYAKTIETSHGDTAVMAPSAWLTGSRS